VLAFSEYKLSITLSKIDYKLAKNCLRLNIPVSHPPLKSYRLFFVYHAPPIRICCQL